MTTNDVTQLRGSTVIDLTGDKVGRVEEIYLDDQTQQPQWLLVNTGLFGTKSTFIPLEGATPQDDAVQVPFEKNHIKDAPGIDPDRHLSPTEEAELYRHYGLDYGQAPQADRGPVGHDTSGPTTDDAMTRSEEQLTVGKTTEEAGVVRLRKYVVTENVTQTVPVQREEVRVEREPITEANIDQATAGPAISEEEHEVVLHQERPVVQKEAVPVERVRLDKDTVSEEQTVSDEIRKEQIEVEGGESRR